MIQTINNVEVTIEAKANLSGADLSKADLSEANLSEANLSEADLYRADLIGANLSGADLYRANLFGANLYRADLSRTNLTGADLTGACGIISFGPIGEQRRIGYIINGPTIMVQLGCFYSTLGEALAAIALKYGNNSKYAALVIAAAATLADTGQ